MRKLAHVPTLIILLGGGLMLAAYGWLQLKDSRDYWPEEDAKALTKAGLEYHGAAHRMTHAHTEADKQEIRGEYEEARSRYTESKAAFLEAEERYARPFRIMWWSGMTCLVVGVLGYVVIRSAASG
jgi:hypothetical protein